MLNQSTELAEVKLQNELLSNKVTTLEAHLESSRAVVGEWRDRALAAEAKLAERDAKT